MGAEEVEIGRITGKTGRGIENAEGKSKEDQSKKAENIGTLVGTITKHLQLGTLGIEVISDVDGKRIFLHRKSRFTILSSVFFFLFRHLTSPPLDHRLPDWQYHSSCFFHNGF